jgi:hypothetical protein
MAHNLFCAVSTSQFDDQFFFLSLSQTFNSECKNESKEGEKMTKQLKVW